MTREEAARIVEAWAIQEAPTSRDGIAFHDAASALRRLDELERWAKAHMETIGHYGDPWGEELGVYNTMNALLRAIVDGSMTWPEKEKPCST